MRRVEAAEEEEEVFFPTEAALGLDFPVPSHLRGLASLSDDDGDEDLQQTANSLQEPEKPASPLSQSPFQRFEKKLMNKEVALGMTTATLGTRRLCNTLTSYLEDKSPDVGGSQTQTQAPQEGEHLLL